MTAFIQIIYMVNVRHNADFPSQLRNHENATDACDYNVILISKSIPHWVQ